MERLGLKPYSPRGQGMLGLNSALTKPLENNLVVHKRVQ